MTTARRSLRLGLLAVVLLAAALPQAFTGEGDVYTFAGSGAAGFYGDGGPALQASLLWPAGTAVAPDGTIFFADDGNYRIRRIDPSGIITTVAGTGAPGFSGDGGPATAAQITGVISVALDPVANVLYFADVSNLRVRRVDLTTGIISTLAGFTQLDIWGPLGVALGRDGDVYVTDWWNCGIRRVTPDGGMTHIAGSGTCGTVSSGDGGPATAATFVYPSYLTVDASGNIFLFDHGFEETDELVRRIDGVTGIITTVAGGGTTIPGSGPATSMSLFPVGASNPVLDSEGNLLIATRAQILKVDLATGHLTVFAGQYAEGFSGDGGPALYAQFHGISGLSFMPDGTLLVSDTLNMRIRAIAPAAAPPPPPPTDIIISASTSQAFLDRLTTVSGHLIFTDVDDRASLALPNLTHVAGNIVITDNDQLATLNLGAVVSVGGFIDISRNPLLTSISLPALAVVTGDLSAGNNGGVTVIDVGLLQSVGGSIDITGNDDVTVIHMGGLQTVGGSIDVTDNTAVTVIDVEGLQTVGGTIDVTGNDAVTIIDLNSLQAVGGSVDITDNDAVTIIDLDGLQTVGGSIDITGNDAVTVIDMGNLQTIGGNFNADATDTVAATTANGTTTVSLAFGGAAMTAQLPAGAFTSPTSFSVHSLSGDALLPESGTTQAGAAVTVDPVAAYQFTFAVPALNSPATLTFDIDLTAVDGTTRDALLEAIATGAATLATRSDAAGSNYQTFPICEAGVTPTAGGCVRVEWLDSVGQPVADAPARLRFSNVVGHFSTWAVAIVTPGSAPAAVFNGLLAPYQLGSPSTPAFQRGRVIPLKFNWVDITGAVIDSAAASPSVVVHPGSCEGQPAASSALAPDDAGRSGWQYDVVTRTWTFGWNTRPFAVGCYWIQISTAAPALPSPSGLFPVALRDR